MEADNNFWSVNKQSPQRLEEIFSRPEFQSPYAPIKEEVKESSVQSFCLDEIPVRESFSSGTGKSSYSDHLGSSVLSL